MRRFAGCLALTALLAACSSSGHVSTPGSTGTTSIGNTTSTSQPTPPTRVLRGVPVPSFECSRPAESSGVRRVPIEGVQAFRLCPLGAPGSPSRAVTVGANDPAFARLVRALSAPDEPATIGAVCPAYADQPQVVLAKTAGRDYQVSIPTDACRHYQREALDALNRARGN